MRLAVACGEGMSLFTNLNVFVLQLIYEEEQRLPVLPARARQIDADDTQYCDGEHGRQSCQGVSHQRCD